MWNLTLTQQYLLCVLNQKGRLPTLGLEKVVGLSMAAVLELLLEKTVVLEEKKLSAPASLPQEQEYLLPVYDFIAKKQPVKPEKVVEYFSLNLTDRNFTQLLDGVGMQLVNKGCAVPKQDGFLGKKTAYLPARQAVDLVVEGMRAQLLEEGPVSQETAALAALLDKSGELGRFFSAYEKKTLTSRLKELRQDQTNRLVCQAMEYIDSLMAAIIVAVT